MSWKNTSLTISCLIFSLSASETVASVVRETQDTFSQLIDVRKVISQTRADWLEEKEVVNDMVSLLRDEKRRLEQRVEALEEDSTETDALRSSLNAEREELLAVNRTLSEVLPELESSVRSLLPLLPDPLIADLSSLLQRLPTSEESKLPLSQRLLTVVGILNRIDKFNSEISVISEIRQVETKSLEVKTIYFGLAAAYFASPASDYAGLGQPGEDGWQWSTEKSLSKPIQDLIRTYEGTREAVFTQLPISIL
ncbi:MAG: DUF3450 family protein [Puniceicoccaceae bacterium]